MNKEINEKLESIREALEADSLQEAVDPQDHAAKLLAKHQGLEKMLTDKVKKLSSAFVGANKRLERHRKTGVGESEAIFLLKSTKKTFDELRSMMDMIEKEYKKGGV